MVLRLSSTDWKPPLSYKGIIQLYNNQLCYIAVLIISPKQIPHLYL